MVGNLNKSIRSSWFEVAADYPDLINPGVRVGQTDQTGTIGDMVNLFSERFEYLHKVISKDLGFKRTYKIAELNKQKMAFKNRPCNVIGIVVDIRRTKSGGRMVELEDKTGRITVFVRKEDPAAGTLLLDDVIGVTGKFSEDGRMFWTDRVQYPEVLPNNQNKGGLDFDPVSIAFASDIHMGSTKFLEKDWDRMVEWMNSEHHVAKNIKYFVLSGDIVDGVGVYPGHERNITMLDVYDQYEFCARKLDELPEHITPIILPGNHDAVRPAEPQPQLEPLIQQRFNSAVHVGNPARIDLSGIDVLSYHGKGIDDMVPRMAHVTYERPAEAMKEMLKKRHLAPMWGERNALSPEEEDQMLIREQPDLFVTGHTHAHQMEWYRGIPLVVSSTFQGETDFMQMLGYKPKMGLLSVYNIQNREMKAFNFHQEETQNLSSNDIK
jgi:DNA polymerase II small subunit|tara:strand:- start:896 stop:2206 length:1311 start_codon:yes stop_codon:yes gene_type:complete